MLATIPPADDHPRLNRSLAKDALGSKRKLDAPYVTTDDDTRFLDEITERVSSVTSRDSKPA